MKRNGIIQVVKEVVSQNRVKKAYLFGSFARGQKKYNDIDLAINPPDGFTLLDLSRMANAIEEKTKIPVDVVTLRSINPKLKKAIEKEMIAV